MDMAENIHCSLKTGGRRLLCLLLCALLISGAASAARAETYEENAFGFVDTVMDSGDGIPEDAEGRLGRIREVGVLRVATEPYFVPQEYIDPSLSGQARFVGADMDGTPMTQLSMTGPIGLVIGAEGSGVSRLVREKCDMTASIPMKGEIDSLNASVAAGVLMYEILRQRG